MNEDVWTICDTCLRWLYKLYTHSFLDLGLFWINNLFLFFYALGLDSNLHYSLRNSIYLITHCCDFKQPVRYKLVFFYSQVGTFRLVFFLNFTLVLQFGKPFLLNLNVNVSCCFFQPSPEYPNYHYLCKVCSVHIENVHGAYKHIKEKRHKKNMMVCFLCFWGG